MALQQDSKKPEAKEYSWPSRDGAQVIGQALDRLDGMAKTTGAAKYTYDVNLKNQLIAMALGCPYAHCRIKSLDTRAAESVAGVVSVYVLPQGAAGSEIQWQGELLAVVAAESEGAAHEGVAALKLDFETLDVFVNEEDLDAAQGAGRTTRGGSKVELEREPGDDDDEDEFAELEIARLFEEADYTVEGYYGIDVITHCCLEPHGSTVVWEGDKLTAYLSTQNVSGTNDGFAGGLSTDEKTVTADEVEVICNYVGGGFGSKFAPDFWGIAAAQIAKNTGRPVKLMLTRDQELKIAGSRPSGYVHVKVGADKNGVVSIWDSHHWGTSGYRGGGVSQGVMPYVIRPKNYRRVATNVKTNNAQARAWRAPNHPQACALTQTAIDDLAAEMGKDSLDVFMANCQAGNIDSKHPQAAEVYMEELKIAARLMGWKDKWHPHGKGRARGSIVDGLGMALHTWGGVANDSTATVRVYPDGGVESFCGSQDVGTGTRTIIAQVLAETFGLGIKDVRVNIGSSKYPASGASGGSTTVGGVSESHRRASQDILRQLNGLVAKKLGVPAASLYASGGRIQSRSGKGMSWTEACRLLGLKPLEITNLYERFGGRDGLRATTDDMPSTLSDEGVCGVQMAHAEVDRETGQVRMKKLVAVQDQGLVINPKTCKSQIYGAVVMGIHAALFEQRINDPSTGAFVNAEMSDYKLARLGDTGEIVVELYEPESERKRGVIGNGEPPVIAPTTAISNAVCNALGVRVPVIPLTPKRVLEALAAAGRA